MNNIRLSAIISMTFLIGAVASIGCGDVTSSAFQEEVGGNYPPVTDSHFKKAKFSHRTGRTKFVFDWKIDDNKFVIEGKNIPQDLIDVLLGKDKSASKIEGTWSIKNEKIHFVVHLDETGKKTRNSKLPIYFTGVIRIETKSAQYVF